MEAASTNRPRAAASPFDFPLTLPLAFGLAVLEVAVNRGMGVLVTYTSPRGPLAGVMSGLVFTGLLVNYLSTFMCLVLVGHALGVIVARKGFLQWPRKITVSAMGAVTVVAILALLLSPLLFPRSEPDRVLNLIVTCQLSITVLGMLIGFTVLTVRTGWIKRVFAVVPVAILLVVLAPQFFYFYPTSRPEWFAPGLSDGLLVTAHALALAFPFTVAFYLAYQHMKHGLPVFIHVLVAISGFFPVLMLSNMPSTLTRDLFTAMLGMQMALPAPTVLYPLATLPLLFIFSMLVGTPVASRSFLVSRRRAGMGFGLMYIGTFTPLTAPQAAFLAAGLILWAKSIVLE